MIGINRLALKLAAWVPPAILGLVMKKTVPNLSSDRDVEWSWVATQMPGGLGAALDFGPGTSYLGLIAAQRSFEVTAIDLEPVQWYYCHKRLNYRKGDILKLDLPQKHFDLVINCSTIEHVGLAGRYGRVGSEARW